MKNEKMSSNKIMRRACCERSEVERESLCTEHLVGGSQVHRLCLNNSMLWTIINSRDTLSNYRK